MVLFDLNQFLRQLHSQLCSKQDALKLTYNQQRSHSIGKKISFKFRIFKKREFAYAEKIAGLRKFPINKKETKVRLKNEKMKIQALFLTKSLSGGILVSFYREFYYNNNRNYVRD
jgi:hypothetical protein